MKIREFYLPSWMFRKGVLGITIYPFILYSKELKKDPKLQLELIEHEWEHIDQANEKIDKHGLILGWIKFYGSYLNETRKKGYRQNKYEKDAYDDDE